MPPTKSPEHDLPQDPTFYRRVLDYLPGPVIVLDTGGNIIYGNKAMADLAGWSVEEAIGTNILEYLHPDDLAWVAESFAYFTGSPDARQAVGETTWSGLRFRIMTRDGRPIPIEATGGGGLYDPIVNGIMYSVRSARDEYLLDDIFSGLAQGSSLESLMQHIVDIVTSPPMAIDAAIYEQRADGSHHVMASTSPTLTSLPVTSIDNVPWSGLRTEPRRVEVEHIVPAVGQPLLAAGYRDCFHAGAHAPDMFTTLRLVALTPERHDPADGPMQRIERARELMSLVLLKMHNDRMLADAAARDDLTGLPNRLGLTRRFERMQQQEADYAVLFVDLDGFKEINDRMGHATGDRVLATVSDRLRRAVRVEDVVARIGGDEFAILIGQRTSHLDGTLVRRFADRIVSMLGEPVPVDGIDVIISASVGISRIEPGHSLSSAIQLADGAMYTAKRAGGGRYASAQHAA